jgi:hypothetical protein
MTTWELSGKNDPAATLERARFGSSAPIRSLSVSLRQLAVNAGPTATNAEPGITSDAGPGHYLEAFDPNRLLKLLHSLEPEVRADPAEERTTHAGAISSAKTYSQHPRR